MWGLSPAPFFFFFVLFLLLNGGDMSLKIAETHFITKHDSGVAAADVYHEQAPSTPVNTGSKLSDFSAKSNLPHTGNKQINGFLDGVYKQAGLSTDHYVSPVEAGYKLGQFFAKGANRDAILNSAKTFGINSALTNLGFDKVAGELGDQILGGHPDPSKIIGLIGKQHPEWGLWIQGAQLLLDHHNRHHAQKAVEILNLIDQVNEPVEVVDLVAQKQLILGLLTEAIKARSPELVERALSQLKNEKDRKELLFMCVLVAGEASDLVTLNKILDFFSGSSLLATYPTLVKTILSNYKTLSGKDPTKEDGKDLVDTLTRITPKWLYTKRGNEEVYDLSIMSKLSDHGYKALLMVRHGLVPLLLRNKYDTVKVIEHTKKLRPWIMIE